MGNEADPFEVRLYRKKADQTSAQLFAVLPINTVVDLGDKTSGEVTWANLATAKFSADFELPPILMGTDKTALRLEPYENLYLGVSSALTNGVNVFAIGGQYE
ncbi:hypothetical protein [Nodosilinea nodulosa]|uniref:hypothetical protein n=1 Tax=Nodosilinea nodulosa TaxID=416001 RepID=UPI0012D81086|nr:hypothetical protein [Nodosilinea nodulosa]